MPLPTNLDVYSDVERAFRLAIANPNGAIQPMPGGSFAERKPKATRWRQRAYHYRNLLRKATEAYAGTSRAGMVGKSDYDALVITITDEGHIKMVVETNVLPAPIPLDGIVPEPRGDVLAELPVVDFSHALALAKEAGLDLE